MTSSKVNVAKRTPEVPASPAKKRHPVRRGFAITGLALAASMATNPIHHFWGISDGPDRSPSTRLSMAQARFDSAHSAASPLEKFSMQFLQTTVVDIQLNPHGKGILGGLSEPGAYGTYYHFGQTCLRNTPYDTSPTEITSSTDDGTVTGKFYNPAGIAADPADPDTLIVASGNTNMPNLIFRGLLADQLTPANAITSTELSLYKCAAGMLITKDNYR